MTHHPSTSKHNIFFKLPPYSGPVFKTNLIFPIVVLTAACFFSNGTEPLWQALQRLAVPVVAKLCDPKISRLGVIGYLEKQHKSIFPTGGPTAHHAAPTWTTPSIPRTVSSKTSYMGCTCDETLIDEVSDKGRAYPAEDQLMFEEQYLFLKTPRSHWPSSSFDSNFVLNFQLVFLSLYHTPHIHFPLNHPLYLYL